MNVRFKKVRESLGITQEMVHKKLGISIQRLSGYENGRREPDLDTLVALADYYGVSTDYLVGRDSETYQLPEPMDFSKFGKRLQEFRKQRQISLDELAEELGASVDYLTDVENGTEIPRMDFCINLLNILEFTPDAAFMDMSSEGYLVRANYIRDRAQALTPKERERFLDYQEYLLKAFESKKKGKSEFKQE